MTISDSATDPKFDELVDYADRLLTATGLAKDMVTFRDAVEECFAYLEGELDFDLRQPAGIGNGSGAGLFSNGSTTCATRSNIAS